MTTKVKICGLTIPADVKIVNETLPDYAGFVFAPGRHHISTDQASKLRALLDPSIVSVGVFVDAPLDVMLNAVDSGAISIVQLHGHEPETVVELLQSRGVPVVRVFQGHQDTRPTTAADYVMLDTGAGSGRTLDWRHLTATSAPLFLAGGLTPTNVATEINAVSPFAVDVSSGVESGGHKDPVLVRDFIRNVRAATTQAG
ncbi:phosphoribosylanthranilate isomerase [Lacticaseibacillus pantheris]